MFSMTTNRQQAGSTDHTTPFGLSVITSKYFAQLLGYYHYIRQEGYAFPGVCVWICLLFRLPVSMISDYTRSPQLIFMKPCMIMYYCYRKNPLNFMADPAKSGRLAATLNF